MKNIKGHKNILFGRVEKNSNKDSNEADQYLAITGKSFMIALTQSQFEAAQELYNKKPWEKKKPMPRKKKTEIKK